MYSSLDPGNKMKKKKNIVDHKETRGSQCRQLCKTLKGKYKIY